MNQPVALHRQALLQLDGNDLRLARRTAYAKLPSDQALDLADVQDEAQARFGLTSDEALELIEALGVAILQAEAVG